jgi:hypothetical protein
LKLNLVGPKFKYDIEVEAFETMADNTVHGILFNRKWKSLSHHMTGTPISVEMCEQAVTWDSSTFMSELLSLKLKISNPKCVSFIAVLNTTSLTRRLVMAALTL